MIRLYCMTGVRIQIVLFVCIARDLMASHKTLGAVGCYAVAALLLMFAASTDHELAKLLTAQNAILGDVMKELGKFVIRMANGNYYAPTATNPYRTAPEIENAKTYPSRFAALEDMAKGPQFAGSAIVPAEQSR